MVAREYVDAGCFARSRTRVQKGFVLGVCVAQRDDRLSVG
jgi:hypothetical protein